MHSESSRRCVQEHWLWLIIWSPIIWLALAVFLPETAERASSPSFFWTWVVVALLSPLVLALALVTLFWALVTSRLFSRRKMTGVGLLVLYTAVFVYLAYQVVASLLGPPYRGGI